jgi:hypothetical protein
MSSPAPHRSRVRRARAELRDLVKAIRDEELEVADLLRKSGRSRRILVPLSFVVGALALLLHGVRLLLVNRRLVLIQILPAVWVWVAMLDLKAHVLHGRSFHVIRGPLLIPLVALIVALTMAGFFLNAVFAYAITSAKLDTSVAFAEARKHARPPLAAGACLGLLLAFSALIATRWPRPWFTVSMGIAVGLLMITYVAVPARMIGVRAGGSRRDRLTASLLSTVLGTTVSTPPYLLGRAGILMLGSKALFIPGILLLVGGAVLQMGATGTVRAVKFGAAFTDSGDRGTRAAANLPDAEASSAREDAVRAPRP